MALKSLGTASDQIQTGTTAERPTLAASDAGNIRFNTTTGLFEQWDGSTWSSLSTGSGTTLNPATLAEAAAGTLTTVYSSPETAVPKDASGMTGAALIPTGTTAESPSTQVAGMLRRDSTVGAFFASNGTDFIPFDQRKSVVTSSSATVAVTDHVVVDTAGQTITLPSSPLAGTMLTIVVGGNFKDTVVARNGSNIMGLAEDMTLDIEYAALQFTYTDATNGWRVN